jgi:hypothetical protein
MDNLKNIKLISYPKSGSTYLRFVLANIYWPETEHDFDTVHRLIPALGSREMEGHEQVRPQFYKTHDINLFDFDSFVIFRHVGDVLISFYHHNRKFYNLGTSLEDYIESTDYGVDWRIFINSIINFGMCGHQIIKYEDLISDKILRELGKITILSTDIFDTDLPTNDRIEKAIKRSSFENMQKIENTKGLGKDYGQSNPGIKFVREGRSGQWEDLPGHIKDKILSKNKRELELLNYI